MEDALRSLAERCAGISDPDTLAELLRPVVRGGWQPTVDLVEPSGPPVKLGSVRFVRAEALGQGGTGTVFRAFDQTLQRSVAMKVWHLVANDSAETTQRFLREARMLASLQHPHIVPLFDVGVLPDGRPWIAMQEVSGDSAQVRLHEVATDAAVRATWPLPRLVRVVLTVARTVAFAHARGVLHRDLKPANVMLGSSGDVYVVDWGLAVIAERAGPGRAGTPGFMAPEQERGEPATRASDVFGLGGLLRAVLDALPTAEGTDADSLSALQSVAERACAPDPSARFEDATTLADALEGWLDGTGRRRRALAVVQAALSAATETDQRIIEGHRLRAEADTALEGIPRHAPEVRKLEGWRLEAAAEAQLRAARLHRDQTDRELHKALQVWPGLPEAHAELASRHQRRHAAAEAARRIDDAAREEAELRVHVAALPKAHDTHRALSAYLAGDGALTIVTDPPGAEVWLVPWVEHRRRLVEGEPISLGLTPLNAVPVAMGRYVCILRHPACEDVRYPVEITRQHHWNGCPPGDLESRPVPLPRRGTLGADQIYVPGGYFRIGGDPGAALNPVAAQRLWCDGFVMQRFPVTNAQYIAFLDDLVRQGRVSEALAHAPRDRSGKALREDDLGPMIYGQREDGTFELQPDADGDLWYLDDPVSQVPWRAAAAYAQWLGVQTGQAWRLPGELEWEKAARGVDARYFPWGDFLDPSWTCMIYTHEGPMRPHPVQDFPLDVSPYGIRGLGGNVADWVADYEGRVEDGRVVPPKPSTEHRAESVQARGGNWYYTAAGCRSANRGYFRPHERNPQVGFRCVYGFPSG